MKLLQALDILQKKLKRFFNVTPDLACFAKAMSNGVPLSAVVGKNI